MNWRWWKKMDTTESQRAFYVARLRNLQAHSRRPHVQDQAAWSREKSEANGLTKLFNQLMEQNRA